MPTLLDTQRKGTGIPPFLTGVDIVVCQNEIPLDTTLHFLRVAHEGGKITMFNVAPARGSLPDACLGYVSVLVVNESEASQISGVEVSCVQSATSAATALQRRGARTVVVTLGAQGCVLLEEGVAEPEVLACPKVEKVVDTSGAGDCWVGCFAYYLSVGKSMKECCRRAGEIASVSVREKGTQASYPAASDLHPDLLS